VENNCKIKIEKPEVVYAGNDFSASGNTNF